MSTKSSRPVVAVIGGGQLVRMMVPAAIRLGITLRVLAESADDPIVQLAQDVRIGSPTDAAAVRDLVRDADVLTFEHEHIPPKLLTALAAEGIAVRPGPQALLAAQDKLYMRRKLDALGLPTPQWAELANPLDAEKFSANVGWPLIIKTPRGGYDGHGVAIVQSAKETTPWFENHDTLLGEELVDFTRELAVLVARRPSGEIRAWPVTETIQVNGKCFQTTAPVLGLDTRVEQEALAVATALATQLNVVGVLAVEMFQLREQRLDGARVVVNELAMRPHNSGHWTIDGAATSQFEQHLRAVLDLPLGSTNALAPWNVMVNVLGGSRTELPTGLPAALADPELRVELYGKAVRPERKVGHVTAHGRDITDVTRRAIAGAAILKDLPGRDAEPGRSVDATPTAPMYAAPPTPKLRSDGSEIAPDYIVRPIDDLGQQALPSDAPEHHHD